MADSFIKHPIDISRGVTVIWSEDLSVVEGYVIDGHKLSRYEGADYFLKKNELSHNKKLLENLFMAITVLRYKILTKHC